MEQSMYYKDAAAMFLWNYERILLFLRRTRALLFIVLFLYYRTKYNVLEQLVIKSGQVRQIANI